MCGPKFCSMSISHNLRANKKAIDLEQEAEEGMRAKSVEFVSSGAAVYTEVAD
jgi:phosphomethylpyrimidine synthase